jgi:hypothetical protein
MGVSGGVEDVVASGAAWVDTFTRATNTDITGAGEDPNDCASEGPNGDCGWVEYGGDWSIDTSGRLKTPGDQTIAISDTATDTIAQYSGATLSAAVSGKVIGVQLRSLSTAGLTDCSYWFGRTGASTMGIYACQDANEDCGIIEPVTSTVSIDDGVGLSVDDGIGDAVVFTTWRFATADPPSDFADWPAAAILNWTVCAEGCDAVWNAAPSAAKCTADGTYVGVGHRNTSSGQYTKWVGGDVP